VGKRIQVAPAEFELLTAGKGQKRMRRKKKTFAKVTFCPLLRYFLQNSALKDPWLRPLVPLIRSVLQ
jgi:hypothetical protein